MRFGKGPGEIWDALHDRGSMAEDRAHIDVITSWQMRLSTRVLEVEEHLPQLQEGSWSP